MPVQDKNNLQEKIDEVIGLLEREVSGLRLSYSTALEKLKSEYEQEIAFIHTSFHERCSNLHKGYINQLLALDDHVHYLKELQEAQRIMMQDSILYMKELEKRVGHP